MHLTLLGLVVLILVFFGLLYAANRWAPPWAQTAIRWTVGVALALAVLALAAWVLSALGVFHMLRSVRVG